MVTLSSLPLVVAIAAGLGLAGYGFRRFYRQELANPYDATTTGTVLESDLDPEASAQRGDYTPHVRYEYTVDGVDYENDHVRAGGPLSRRGGTVLLGEYHEDATVTVHYDPTDPDRAVLVPPEGGQTWLLLVVAGLLVAVIAGTLGVLGF